MRRPDPGLTSESYIISHRRRTPSSGSDTHWTCSIIRQSSLASPNSTEFWQIPARDHRRDRPGHRVSGKRDTPQERESIFRQVGAHSSVTGQTHASTDEALPVHRPTALGLARSSVCAVCLLVDDAELRPRNESTSSYTPSLHAGTGSIPITRESHQQVVAQDVLQGLKGGCRALFRLKCRTIG